MSDMRELRQAVGMLGYEFFHPQGATGRPSLDERNVRALVVIAGQFIAELDAAGYAVVPKIPPVEETIRVCNKHGIDSSLTFLDAWQELIAITKGAGDERG